VCVKWAVGLCVWAVRGLGVRALDVAARRAGERRVGPGRFRDAWLALHPRAGCVAGLSREASCGPSRSRLHSGGVDLAGAATERGEQRRRGGVAAAPRCSRRRCQWGYVGQSIATPMVMCVVACLVRGASGSRRL